MVELRVVAGGKGASAPKLTAAQRRVLVELCAAPGQDLVAIARVLGTSSIGASKVVSNLAAAKLIEVSGQRSIQGPVPFEYDLYAPTAAGRAAVAPKARGRAPRVKIVRLDENDVAVLYHRYPRQTMPQSCFVELDCARRQLSADWNGEVGTAVPADVWHGHRRRYPIPCLTAKAANELLDEIAPLAARVCDGYASRWNGQNHVASFTEAAADAERQIRALCEEADPEQAVKVWDAADWFAGLGNRDRQRRELGITAATTDEELDAIESREQTEAEQSGECHWLEGLGRHLRQLRDDAAGEE
jgi:hypothetical protein